MLAGILYNVIHDPSIPSCVIMQKPIVKKAWFTSGYFLFISYKRLTTELRRKETSKNAHCHYLKNICVIYVI